MFDWITEKMWCDDCGQVVDAIIDIDPDTGAKEPYCPNNKTHDLESVHECRTEGCDSLIPQGVHFCKWCMEDLKLAAKKFVDALPQGMDISDALQEAIDNGLF